MRKLIPISQLTPAQIDQVRMAAEARLLAEAAKKGFAPTDMVVADILPNADLGLAALGGAFDYWLTAALVANTSSPYISHKLDDDEWVAIYGIAINDATPSTRKVQCQVGTAITLVDWQLEEVFCDMVPIGISEEYALWLAGDTVTVNLLPQVTKAAGDHIVLVGLICMPKGKRITK